MSTPSSDAKNSGKQRARGRNPRPRTKSSIKAQVDSPCFQAAGLLLFVRCFLESRDIGKYLVERWRAVVEHHGGHCPVVGTQILHPAFVRQEPQRAWTGGVVIRPARSKKGGFVLGDLREKFEIGGCGFSFVRCKQ